MNIRNLGYDQKEKVLLDEIAQLKIENKKLRSDLTAFQLTNMYFNRNEKKFEQLFNNISDAVYYLKIDEDGIPGNFIEVNKLGYSRLGYTREEMLKMSPFDIDIHEKEETIKILKMIKDNERTTFESVHICKDGSYIPVEINTHILDMEGEKHILSVCRDITERKHGEDLKIQAEKLNIVAQLAAGIAHEIRNPLTSLKGFMQLFRTGTVPNKEILDILESEIERINTISGEFLTLAKPINTNFSPIDLQELLKNVEDILYTEAKGRSVSILTKFSSEKIMVKGVGTELKKAFLNLIKNAMESMPAGGDINILVENMGRVVNIFIQDGGIGMTDEQVKRLGEPFFTTKETGTGLGLMITFNIINTHHGEIKVKSKVNEGTTFTVMLPTTK